MSAMVNVHRSWELLVNLTLRDLRSKYRATALGHLWSLANPLTIMAVYTVVFGLILRVSPPAGDPSGLDVFAIWLLCGLLPWNFFTMVANGGMLSITSNENLIKKVAFPRSALVVSNAIGLWITWTLEMAVLVLVLVVFGANPLPWIPLVLLLMILMGAFATGLSLLLSIVNVYFRDIQHFVVILLQVWFFLTPIIYPESLTRTQSDRFGPIVGSWTLHDFYVLNPLCQFVEAFRNLLYDNRLPDLTTSFACLAWSTVALAGGYWVFHKYERGLAEAL